MRRQRRTVTGCRYLLRGAEELLNRRKDIGTTHWRCSRLHSTSSAITLRRRARRLCLRIRGQRRRMQNVVVPRYTSAAPIPAESASPLNKITPPPPSCARLPRPRAAPHATALVPTRSRWPPNARCRQDRSCAPALLGVPGELQVVPLARHPDRDEPEPGPGVEPAAQHPDFGLIAACRKQREANSGGEQGAAAVVHRYSITCRLSSHHPPHPEGLHVLRGFSAPRDHPVRPAWRMPERRLRRR